MQRDLDFVRDILLRVESVHLPRGSDLLDNSDDEKRLILNEHLIWLEQAGFITANKLKGFTDTEWIKIRLTWKGCEYLDNIRDPEIWAKTKESAGKISGFSLEIMGELAKGLIKQQIKKHTGIDVEV